MPHSVLTRADLIAGDITRETSPARGPCRLGEEAKPIPSLSPCDLPRPSRQQLAQTSPESCGQ